MSARIEIARPPEEDRHPRTKGYLCNICSHHRPRAIIIKGERVRLLVCDPCVKDMVVGILNEVMS